MRFTASSGAEPAPEDADAGDRPEGAGVLMSRRAALAGVSMGAAALLCFVLAAGFSGNGSAASGETAQEVSALRKQIQLAREKADGLPAPKDAERGLVTAQESADQIAQLQNDYRYLTPSVAAAGGKLDANATSSTRRNLVPYFVPSVNQSALGPWYLLAGDKDIPSGAGNPMSFASGFTWVAQRPYTINDDGTARVTWLAVDTRPAAGQAAAVFAWARATFDLTRKTFLSVETGATTAGEAMRLEVKAS
jgi:hypothetical protein